MLETMLRQAEAMMAAENFRDAYVLFDRVLQANPKAAAAYSGAATCSARLGMGGVAIGLFNAAIAVAPQEPTLWANLGLALRHCGHVEWARAAYQKALSTDRQHVQALIGMAGSFVNEGNPSAGAEWARRALAVAPGDDNAAQELALCLLEQGKWAEAWPFWRRRLMRGHRPRNYPGTVWQGEAVDWLIVHGEQGLGDEVMFLGCLPELMSRARQGVVIEVNPKLVDVVRRSFPRATVIGSDAEFVHPGDGTIAFCRMGDLAEFCADKVPPKRGGYLRAEMQTGYSDAVLLAMAGGTPGTHDYLRNPPTEAWAPVVAAIRSAGLRPVSIQYGPNGPAMAEALGIEHDAAASGGENLTGQAQALVSAVALVSVPQTALHLAGALDVRTLGVVADKPAWRYGLSGPMPWYRSVELFRVADGEQSWKPVMTRIAATVTKMAKSQAA